MNTNRFYRAVGLLSVCMSALVTARHLGWTFVEPSGKEVIWATIYFVSGALLLWDNWS